jgi:formylglycine-generating enzyme required for sulfatase activity
MRTQTVNYGHLLTGERLPVRSLGAFVAVSFLAVLMMAPAPSLQAAPRKPAGRVNAKFQPVKTDAAYVKLATWQDSLLASMKKVIADNPTAGLGRVQMSRSWLVRGPLACPAGKTLADCDFGVPLRKPDLKKKGSDNKPIWSGAPKVQDGRLTDLKLSKRSSLFLYRSITVANTGPMETYVGCDAPLTLWLNGKKIIETKANQTDAANPELVTLKLAAGKGVRNELLIRIDNVGEPQTHRFYTAFDDKSRILAEVQTEIVKKLRKDFTSPRDLYQQNEAFKIRSQKRGVWTGVNWSVDDSDVHRSLVGNYIKLMKRKGNERFIKLLSQLARDADDRETVTVISTVFYNYQLRGSLRRSANFPALRRAAVNAQKTWDPETLPRVAKYRSQLDELANEYSSAEKAALPLGEIENATLDQLRSLRPMTEAQYDKLTAIVKAAERIKRELMLLNPALDFDKLLFVKRPGGPSLPANWLGNCSMNRNLDDELVVMNMRGPEGPLTRVFKPGRKTLVDLDLNWDGRRVLYSTVDSKTRRWRIYEIILDPVTGKLVKSPGPVTPDMGKGAENYDACYLPDERVIFSSTAVRQGVPCIGGSAPIANLYLLSADRKRIRQLCFDQDHNWNPAVMNNGRILYTRWEYMDIPHYYSRLLFHMNPDGTDQKAFYGSNSIWPNSIFFARPIPGDSRNVAAIVSGHHGVARVGELVILDPGKGRHEAEGVVQRIPGYGKKVQAIISDSLVNSSWPKFLHPCPVGGGTFLVSCQPTADSFWGVYLVDMFDNILLLKEQTGSVMVEPLAFRSTPKPPVIADKVDLARRDATVNISDIYIGPGLKGVPRGTVDRLRVFTLHYGYNGVGGWSSIAIEGSWEPKRIIGTVPVEKDGSAYFRVPANTPIVLQPIDKQGRALQIMRSWFTAMPGENVSCIGCHEKANSAPPVKRRLANRHEPRKLTPWYGLTRGIDFGREIQPILNAKCIKCHDGSKKAGPDFADTKLGKGQRAMAAFPSSYNQLHPFVRRPGPESDYFVATPLEYHASTSELIQILEKGHYDVKLSAEDWDRLVTWIDMNVQAYGTWAQQPKYDKVKLAAERKLRIELRKKYAFLDEDGEVAKGAKNETVNMVLSRSGPKYVPLTPPKPRRAVELGSEVKGAVKVEGWPFKVNAPPAGVEVSLSDKIKLDLVRIPAGAFVMGSDKGYIDESPRRETRIKNEFYIGATEISNEMYNLFDPRHDTRYADVHGVLKGGIGVRINLPTQPVSRVTWKEAMSFCAWISKKTGDTYTLPTEEQWEWACRAGTDTPHFFGELGSDYSRYANLADTSMKGFADYGRDFLPRDQKISDRNRVTAAIGSYLPNPWGLHNMLGNVSEWTLSDYGKCGSGIDRKVIRGGSWRDRPNKARASWRWGYYKFQPVFDVGFRVVRLARPVHK